MIVKCEMMYCVNNVPSLKGSICNKDDITIGYGNKNGEWVFAECMDYINRKIKDKDT
jgi:hypothetical protein